MTNSQEILDNIQEINIEQPEHKIIRQLHQVISSGTLAPGDRLPSERILADQFNVGRGTVRKAIQKLQLYGIVKTHPQSGTIVAETGITILEGLLSNILELEQPDYNTLIETREILEINTAYLAAQRMEQTKLKSLHAAHLAYRTQIEQDNDGIEEDIMFHIRLAECAQNQVLRSLIMIIAQDIIRLSRENNTCSGARKPQALQEHITIYQAIREQDPEKAKQAMETHLKNTKL